MYMYMNEKKKLEIWTELNQVFWLTAHATKVHVLEMLGKGAGGRGGKGLLPPTPPPLTEWNLINVLCPQVHCVLTLIAWHVLWCTLTSRCSAQKHGLLCEVESDDEDKELCEPFFAHCKTHSVKEITKRKVTLKLLAMYVCIYTCTQTSLYTLTHTYSSIQCMYMYVVHTFTTLTCIQTLTLSC